MKHLYFALFGFALAASACEAESFGAGAFEIVPGAGGRDRFGIAELYPARPDGRVWASNWDNGKPRRLECMDRDPCDADAIARGNGHLEIDGAGELKMVGDAPRFYVYDEPRQKKWQNVEITAYLMRVGEDAEKKLTYRGFGFGARSEHQDADNVVSPGKGPYKGLGYYGKMIYDGRVVFQKELIHHSKFGYSVNQPDPNARNFWKTPGGAMPDNVWIGIKFVIRNLDGNRVKLELYRDLTDGKDGGRWEKVIEYVDQGGWTNPGLTPELIKASMPPDAPEFKTDEVLVHPGTAVFVRNDGVTDARMKKMSIREIAP